ncbi:S8 family peptidase [Paenibacillus sp. P96]|uniref:S8 family peptidase n=1 Tax=Paenibacillus zeirhizosphaerae TaxID=2987519 RepID=A0ABT9FXG5_9BACL|nr:S8 family peptidase [Paenibacillus sp. P96]MDP4099423.1 S8 family peptidase [Paenibacillus sp. P96]
MSDMFKKEQLAKFNLSLRRRIRKLYTSKGGPVGMPVIIRFRHKVTSSRIHALQKHMGSHSFSIKHHIPLLNALSTQITIKGLKRLCSWKGVHRIYLDDLNKASLNVALPSIGASIVQENPGLTGKGINIAVLDTGVYPHPDLTKPVNRIVAFKDYIHNKSAPYDDNGHGTHIAGVIAGNGLSSDGKYKGPASEAGIVGVKVLDEFGEAFDSTVIKGIEWCISNRIRYSLRIISLSLGRAQLAPIKDDLVVQAVEKAVRSGLVVVVSAGNSGPSPRSIECPGTSPSAITVGAVDDRGTVQQKDDRVCSFSSRGPISGTGGSKPDIAAPGEGIISLRAPGSTLVRESPRKSMGSHYFILSGTSVATPIVSGVVAQILQDRPHLTPLQVKTLLKKNAYRRKGMSRHAYGSGVLNARFLSNSKE